MSPREATAFPAGASWSAQAYYGSDKDWGQIDYAKLAAETGLKDARVASATWSPIKKKLFGVASAQAGTASGTASKVNKTKTPRTRKEPTETKTPLPTTKKAAKSAAHVDEEQNEAAFGGDTSEIEPKVKGKVNVSNGTDASSALKAETNGNEELTTNDGEGDSTMVGTPEPVEKGKGKATIANDMSSGDMSPPPATPTPTKAKKAAAPKPKATPKTPKTPTGGASGTAINDTAETPVPDSSGAKKRGRKTKAQKEAEAAAAGENETGDDDEAEKPAKKPRKTPAKKAKKEDVAGDGETTGAGEGGAGEKDTPIKKPRKTPVKKPKKEECAEDGGAADSGVENGEDGTKEKPVKKPRKTPVKKQKKEEADPAGEGSPAGEAAKEKKKPGRKLGAAKAKKAVTPADSSEDVGEEEEQEKIHHGAVAKVVKDAKLANDLDGKHVESKAIRYVRFTSFAICH